MRGTADAYKKLSILAAAMASGMGQAATPQPRQPNPNCLQLVRADQGGPRVNLFFFYF